MSKYNKAAIVDELKARIKKGDSFTTVFGVSKATWGIGKDTFNTYWKEAKALNDKLVAKTRLNEDKAHIRTRVKAVEKGLLTDLECEHILCVIATNNIKVQEIKGGEVVLRGITPTEIMKAVELLFKKRGSNAPYQQEIKGDFNLSELPIVFE